MDNIISMTEKEAYRYEIIRSLERREITANEAALRLGITKRHARRLKRKIRKEGMRGVVHKLRGKRSNRAISGKEEKRIISILKKEYSDFGPTLATEHLFSRHGIKRDVSTIRALMIRGSIWKPKKRKESPQYRAWRPRKEMSGEMEQFDGSYHDWFEGRAQEDEYCLLASIDDATGNITKAAFAENEGVENVFCFWKAYVEENGKPKSLYLDKYSTYKVNHKNAVDNQELMTQFQRATEELDIELITAHSPQAKGRVERLFKTLQDRLVKAMRLEGICDIEKANRYLEEVFIPDFNRKFSVQAKRSGDARRVLGEKEKESLESIFSVRSSRVVSNDFTVRFKCVYYQLEKVQPTTVLRKDTLVIEERLDGSLHLLLRGKELAFRALPGRPEKTKERITALTPERAPVKPAKNHPWRRQLFSKNARVNTQ
jgi:transposase